jgi:hypothetical protein
MISQTPKHTHFAAATSRPADQSSKKSMLFASPKKNFKFFSPTLQKKLKHPTHNPRQTGTLTGYDFAQTDTATGNERRRASTLHWRYCGATNIFLLFVH